MNSNHLSVYARSAMLAIVMVVFAGCATIPTNSVGIEHAFNGSISSDPVGPGMHGALLTSYNIIDTSQTRISDRGLEPKDASGVALNNVDIVVAYSLLPERVPRFYIKTKEMDQEENTPELLTLGTNILKTTVIPNVLQEATASSRFVDIARDLTGYQKRIAHELDHRLNELYGADNPFVIDSVSIQNFKLPVAIQEQVDRRAAYIAQLDTISAEKKAVEAQGSLREAQSYIDIHAQAKALKRASQETGLSPEIIIQFRNANAYATLAERPGATGVLVNPQPVR